MINLAMMPQWVSHNGGERLRFICNRIAATLTPEELNEWRRAVAAGEADWHFLHCRAISLRGGNEAVRLLFKV